MLFDRICKISYQSMTKIKDGFNNESVNKK